MAMPYAVNIAERTRHAGQDPGLSRCRLSSKPHAVAAAAVATQAAGKKMHSER
jgi:hypothetical protein